MYQIFRAAERFGRDPYWFYSLDSEAQLNILAYSEIRLDEEHHMELFRAKMHVG
jgi:hypothetical protein